LSRKPGKKKKRRERRGSKLSIREMAVEVEGARIQNGGEITGRKSLFSGDELGRESSQGALAIEAIPGNAEVLTE